MQVAPTFSSRPARTAMSRWAMPLMTLALGLSLLCVAGSSHAQWRWRDKNGQVNASDRPPPRDIPDKDILGRPAPETLRRGAAPPAAASAAASAALSVPAKGPLEAELEARKRTADQEQAAKTKAEESKLTAQRAENCRRARGHMAALETGQRMARVNEKGEREVLDDRGRADEMRQTRDVIASDCR